MLKFRGAKAMSLDEKFQAAVDIVQKLPKDGPISTSNEQKLKFYSLFKQATIGDVNTSRPGIFSITERYKWDAWKSVEGTSAENAKEKYIEAILEIFENLDPSINVSEWLNGPNLDPTIKSNLISLGVNVN